MCLTKHLTIGNIGGTAMAPRRYMISVHFIQLINPFRIVVMADRAERTVRFVIFYRFSRLLIIFGLLSPLVKDSDIQKRRVVFSTIQHDARLFRWHSKDAL